MEGNDQGPQGYLRNRSQRAIVSRPSQGTPSSPLAETQKPGSTQSDTEPSPSTSSESPSSVYRTCSRTCLLAPLEGSSESTASPFDESRSGNDVSTEISQGWWVALYRLFVALWRALRWFVWLLSPRLSVAAAADPGTKMELRKKIYRGVKGARQIARPFLHIETNLDEESAIESGNSEDSLKEKDASTYERRQRVNACVRRIIRTIPPAELQTSFKVHACTWNVDQQPPPPYSTDVLEWLLGKEVAKKVEAYHHHKQWMMTAFSSEVHSGVPPPTRKAHGDADPIETALPLSDFPDLLVVTLQEVDMGGLALVKESTDSSLNWANTLADYLGVAADSQLMYHKLKVVQLVGLVLILLLQKRHAPYITHVRLSLKRTGAMRVLGNKGSVGMRATIYDKRFLFIVAHFVAHKKNELRRTMNYHEALSYLRFQLPAHADDEVDVLRTFARANTSVSVAESSVDGRSTWERVLGAFEDDVCVETERRVLDQHDYTFFLGDLNSRLRSLSGKDIRRYVGESCFDYLLCHDELRQGMISGGIFDGFQEAWINFPPTYKFDRNTDVYDTSRTRRDPAWCDRVLFRVLDTSRTVASEKDAPIDHASEHELSSPKAPATHAATASLSDGGDYVHLQPLSEHGMAALQTETSSPGSASTPPPERTHPEEVGRSTFAVNPTVFSSRGRPMSLQSASMESTSMLSSTESISPAVFPRDFGTTPTSSWVLKQGTPTFQAASRQCVVRACRPHVLIVANAINVLEYTDVPSLKTSDHRPVLARFEVEVLRLTPDFVERLKNAALLEAAQ